MTQTTETLPAFVESEDPAREFGYPVGIDHVIFAQFGAQARQVDAGSEFIHKMRKLFTGPHEPYKVERGHWVDKAGFHEDVFMAYWMDLAEYERWVKSRDVAQWWATLPEAGEVGYWREILMPDKDRTGFVGFGIQADRMVGCTHAMRAVPGNKWGYWGGYRDRFAATHKGDKLTSDVGTELPDPIVQDSFGKRLRVQAPNNVLFVREGVSGKHITDPYELEQWNTTVKPALEKWVQYLMDNPSSGAFGARDLMEQDVKTGKELDSTSSNFYFLTLRHLERAARVQPSHLALYNAYMGIMQEFAARRVVPALMTWVEAHVMPRGTLELEYVNCHPGSGFLPFFAADSTVDLPTQRKTAKTA